MERHLWSTHPVVLSTMRLVTGKLLWRILVSIGLIILALIIPG